MTFFSVIYIRKSYNRRSGKSASLATSTMMFDLSLATVLSQHALDDPWLPVGMGADLSPDGPTSAIEGQRERTGRASGIRRCRRLCRLIVSAFPLAQYESEAK
jgi:hypothetical protein